MTLPLTKKQLREFTEIMGVSEELIPLFPLLRNPTHTMNPFLRSLPGIFRGLHLKRGQRVLDLPCGEGGVSVPLAVNYGVRVAGYDVFPYFVDQAKKLAKKRGVEELCRFRVADIRNVVRRRSTYDLLLWIAAPTILGRPRSALRALRRCVRHGGLIVIGDAYLLAARKSTDLGNYVNLESTTLAYSSHGDSVIRVIDYGQRFWRDDYRRERKEVEAAMDRVTSEHDRQILKRHLRSLDAAERVDTRDLGGAIWIIRVNRRKRRSLRQSHSRAGGRP
jgi:cyclopropane fatty-acyl-phospholipid synthase-like methyltransferase